MTSQAFLNRLRFSLSYMQPDEIKIVTDFYYKKLRAANTLIEEEQLVKSLGSPEKIALALKEEYFKSKNSAIPDAENNKEEAVENKSESEIPSNDAEESSESESKNASSDDEDDDQFDIIFTKPKTNTAPEEIIHPIENQEITPIYGEKVNINHFEALNEEEISDPEISEEKASALEKAESFSNTFDDLESGDADENENFKTKDVSAESQEIAKNIASHIDIEESEEEIIESQNDFQNTEKASDYPSLESIYSDSSENFEESVTDDEDEDEDEIEEIKEKIHVQGFLQKAFGENTFLIVLFSLILAPVIILAFGLPFIIFVAAEAILIALSIALFLTMTLFSVIGVVEIVYGITTLFKAISIGLLEIGIGLCAFALLMVFIAFIYEYLFAITPKFIKNVFSFYKKVSIKTKNYIWGGEE